MSFEYRAFWLPKDLELADAYEDALSLDQENGRAAICDGVASGMFSGLWARILAAALAGDPPRLDEANSFASWIAECRGAWKGSIDQTELAWHQKAKLEAGAAATALWLELLPEYDSTQRAAASYRLQCSAIGDCCLLHVRDGQILSAFPMDSSRDYERDPAALQSRIGKSDIEPEIMQTDFECQASDLLVLATDALAVWAIRSLEAGETPEFPLMWDWSADQWQQFVLQLRQDHQIRHDDTTLALLRLTPADSAKPRPAAQETLDRLKQSAAGRWLRSFTAGG